MVTGSGLHRVILETLEMVPTAHLSGAQHKYLE